MRIMSLMDPIEEARKVFEAAVEDKATLDEVAAAMALVDDFRPRGMYDPEREAEEDPVDLLYGEAANCYKMAYDALRAKEGQLARSYVRVASIKLDKAREVSEE